MAEKSSSVASDSESEPLNSPQPIIDQYYNMEKTKFAIIFAREVGTDEAISKALKSLDFEVTIHMKPAVEKIIEELKKAEKREDLSCLIVIVITESKKPGEIYADDLNTYKMDDLWMKFKGLASIPKLFIVQAHFDNSNRTDAEVVKRTKKPLRFPKMANYLQMFIENGNPANKSPFGCFIEILAEVLTEKHNEWDVNKMITYVQRQVSEENDVCIIKCVSTLTYLLKFE